MWHIFIISVKESHRRDHVEELAIKLIEKGATVHIIDALYWKIHNVCDELYRNSIHLFKYPNISQAHIGVFVSHRKVWKEISEMNPNDRYIILEDDMNIDDNFNFEEIDTCINSTPTPYDCVTLWRHPHQQSHQKDYTVNEYISNFYYTWGLCAYVVTPSFVKTLCDNIHVFDYPVDEILLRDWFPKSQTYIAIKDYFINEGFIGEGDKGNYKFKSLVWTQ
jgi:GR25 family glycosyltransferase involved in LPS biosynthesis